MRVPRLHFITPVCDPDGLVALVHAGVDAVQVRDKRASDRVLLDFARVVVRKLRPLGATVIVNDRVDIALASGSDGVHLGACDLPVHVARRTAPHLVIGATCRSRAEVSAAHDMGASYAGFGPVFASSTKAGLPDPLGVPAVADATGILPLLAIGGVTAEHVPALVSAGAHGVAVVAAIAEAPDPPTAAKEIASALGPL